MTDESLHVAVVDIGKLENLGWVIKGPSVTKSGTDIDCCIKALTSAMKAGPLALGFEAPMFVPYDRKVCELDKARKNEGDRAFSASPGACVLTKGLVIVPYILKNLWKGLRQQSIDVKPTFKWRKPLYPRNLLLFEAFVTHEGKSNHIECAEKAVDQFPKGWKERKAFKSDIDETSTLNLLGAMLLRTGWIDDVKMLGEPCLVVQPKENKPRPTTKNTFPMTTA